MLLEKVLKETPLSVLKEFFTFWDGEGPAPAKSQKITTALVKHMTDDSLVRQRLKLLSKKLQDVLKFFLRSESYCSNMQHILNSQAFSFMSQYEMEAALNALLKRGFLFEQKKKKKSGGKEEVSRFLFIPEELGLVLQDFLWDEEEDIHNTFSLTGYLERFPLDLLEHRLSHCIKKQVDAPPSVDLFSARLLQKDEIAHRIDALEDEGLKKVVVRAICEFGGVLPSTLYEKIKKKGPAWNHRVWKKKLEKNLLGTVRHLSLGEYGINHFDDTLVIFHEVTEAYMETFRPVDPAAFTEVRSLGVDLVSDISSFLSFISHNKIRLTLNGSIYRTAVNKIVAQFILNKKVEFEEQDIFQYVYAFCLSTRMIQRKGDRNLILTVKGKAWDHQPLERKLFRLLSFAFEEWEPGEDPFHLPNLKKNLVEYMKGLDINRWYEVMTLPFKCRNHYLSNLDNNNIRDAFQNRYQYTQNTNMRDTVQLGFSLYQWLRKRFYLMGLIDLAYVDNQVVALRLNPLGAKGLGIALPDEEAYQQNPLIVNPDFEVILFQEGDHYDLVTQLDKFSVRIKSDNTHHFKITAHSVEKAVAQGLQSADILAVLSENSRVSVPQNVIYSIKEWSEKVMFVEVQKATLLKGRNKEVVDRIIQAGLLKEVLVERLSPTALLISSEADYKTLKKDLEKLGVFIEGEDLTSG